MIGLAVLAAIVILPVAVSAACARFGPRRGLPLSTIAALALVVLASIAVTDVELPLLAGRSLRMSPIAQMGIQLLALVMLGWVMALNGRSASVIGHWLPVAWLSLGGLVLSLLVSALPLALLGFVAAGMLWAFGLPPEERRASSGAVLRYTALLALAVPLLLPAYRLAAQRTVSTPELERIVLALAVPGFALVLGLLPLHAWTISVASGAPREMLLGVTGIVQTAGFVLLLRTFEEHPWLTAQAGAPLILGGAFSALVGGWLAVSARRQDPDDWLVYALVAHSGMMMVGLGTQSRAAAVGVTLLLFARVLAILLLAVAPRVSGTQRRIAVAGATMALAGTPGLAGFPGLWLVLRRLLETSDELPPLPGKQWVPLAILAASGLLFATALRRWRDPLAGIESAEAAPDGAAGTASGNDAAVEADGSDARAPSAAHAEHDPDRVAERGPAPESMAGDGPAEDSTATARSAHPKDTAAGTGADQITAPAEDVPPEDAPADVDLGAQRAVWVLLGLLVAAGFAPQWLAGPFDRALARMFFLLD